MQFRRVSFGQVADVADALKIYIGTLALPRLSDNCYRHIGPQSMTQRTAAP